MCLVTLSPGPSSFTIVVTESGLGIATLLIIQPMVLECNGTVGNTWDGLLLHRVVLCGRVVRPLFTYEIFYVDIIRKVFDKEI